MSAVAFEAQTDVKITVPIEHNTVDNYLQQAAAQAKKEGRKANSLIDESSPYLLQHAYNPVNWYPWGDAAFEKAKKEHKPIFLSIGYSTCHWCHVMAHESFENKEIAALLNKYFISIKVDREQRPDIDAVYMSATQLINGQGGWPMTVFLDDQLRPFHAATYYPPFSSDTHTGLKDVLLKIHELWQQDPELIDEVATSITQRITAMADDALEESVLADNIDELAVQQIRQRYDESFGGFGAAPKFPRPGIFAYLNQRIKSDDKNKKELTQMMKTTLDAMAAGGIYDHVGGGFHRYSVDERWQVPHFEKMLYSQALMVLTYSDFYQIDPQPGYKQIVYDTLAFVQREMRSAEGGYYSALDADSERVTPADAPLDKSSHGNKAEGAYYLWHESELKKNLTADEFDWAKKYFHIRAKGNIDSDPRQEFTELNIFYIDEDLRDEPLTEKQVALFSSIKKKLNVKRQSRPRPHLDDKVITAWNGMMMSAFARASKVFDDPALLAEAMHSADFITQHLSSSKDGQLYRQYRDTRASSSAVLSDYVWLIYGLLTIYDASHESRWLNTALKLQQAQDRLFLDKVSHAYFESAANDKNLLFRSKSIFDDALPAANAIALSNLRRLSALVKPVQQKQSFAVQADKLVSSFASVVNENPAAASMFLVVQARH
ncbi:MAG: thioredoxin domain-containing protein [Gammaproteobacteria bacterium]|nr:thioredoxin domain-containing protein [Gammaproteobacteria bacterium]